MQVGGGGGCLSWNLRAQVNFNVFTIIKNGGEIILWFWDHINRAHLRWKFEIPHGGAKNQSCRKDMVWPIKTCARTGQEANEKRFSSIEHTSFEKKPKSYQKIPYTGKTAFSGSFFGFFLELVSLIELNIFSLTFCFSCTSFDRSHHILLDNFNFSLHNGSPAYIL